MPPRENPFVFGEIIEDANFVNRTDELNQFVRDLADGQKVFLLFPRRFGKSSLVALALLKLKKRHIHTVNLTISSYSSYAQFLEKFCPIPPSGALYALVGQSHWRLHRA
jgi:AAA+ ATPase superfamily predicted ATPase